MVLPGDRALTVVAPRGYPWAFNGPRQSTHRLRIRNYVPLNKLRSNLDGLTLFSPLDTLGADLIHGFNRIPLNAKPFVLGFESHLPRVWGLEKSAYEQFLYGNLLSRRCRRIVAISRHAAGNFHEGVASARLSGDAREKLLSKLEVRYPNLVVPAAASDKPRLEDGLIATFVGGHFGRKGGGVVVRMAELARSLGLPIRFNIVSSLQAGGAIWTDPSREGFFEPYFKLLDQPNITHFTTLPNADVQRLLGQSHVVLLPTLADTFGFSVLEAMAVGTPALATAQAALPEVIGDGIDGMLLAPARTPGQHGWIWPYQRRDAAEFERLFADEVERLANEGIKRLEQLLGNAAGFAAMSAAAHQRALHQFNCDDARVYWDGLYRAALANRHGGHQPVAPGGLVPAAAVLDEP